MWSPEQRMRMWVLWVVASGLGGLLGGLVAGAVGALAPNALAGVEAIALFALLLSIPQWLVLREYVPRAFMWVLLTTAGTLFGRGLSSLAFFLASPTLLRPTVTSDAGAMMTLSLFAAFVGVVVALFQLAVLRPSRSSAGWWVLTSAFAGIPITWAVGWNTPTTLEAGVMSGTLYGSITGLALAWLLHRLGRGDVDVIPDAA
jgi:hypothetical protein